MASVLLGAEGHGVATRGATRSVHVTASRIGTVSLQGVPGQLSIVGTQTGQVTLTGQLNWAGTAPVVRIRLDRGAGVLQVSVQCAARSPCTQNLQLAVPAGTGATVRQPAGRVVVTGLASSLSITATKADVSASGLRSPDLDATITSGHLSATFAAPPQQVGLTLVSAQATIRLPGSVPYRVSQEVSSGYVRVAVPQEAGATRTVTARVHSGELELLPS